MPLQTRDYYRRHLAPLHQQLLRHAITQHYLSGTGIRYDGKDLVDTDMFSFPFCTLSTLELAHLFSIFNGSRVHLQAQHSDGADNAPPGLYFTVINNKVIQGPHKNRSGIFVAETDTVGLFMDGLHIDHFFLNKRLTPPMAWWEAEGSQRLMTFDLGASPGRSWQMLLSYISRKNIFWRGP